jgi:hypothetical protein
LIGFLIVIPAEAGIQEVIDATRIVRNWIPASAGMMMHYLINSPSSSCFSISGSTS